MKKYFEKNWLNPATNKKEKIEVHEYSLEDFEDGSLGYNVRVGKILERNSKTGEFNYYLLPEDEAKKIAARRREYYFEKVELRYSAFKYQFDTKLSKSENCKKLFETEIKSLEESLDNNKLYKKIIVEGERNFNLTNSPNCQISTAGNDRDYINIEAQSKFLKYLKLLFKNEIALKLIGLIGDYNSYNSSQPVYYYIEDVLKEYNITAIKGRDIVLQMRGSVSPDWNKNVIPFIIGHLESINDTKQDDNLVSVLDFTPDKIEELIIQISKLPSSTKPSIYLNQLLVNVKKLNSTEFRFDLFILVRNLCQKNAELFTSIAHREDISNWLKKAGNMKIEGSNVFNNIWGKKVDSEKVHFEENTKHTNNLLPEFNFNFFNNACFQLFHYLIENYEKEGNIKYINIYYFLKQSAINDSEKYRFKMRIEKDYKPFIKKLYNKSITKFEKAQYAYDETELPILNDLEKRFNKTL